MRNKIKTNDQALAKLYNESEFMFHLDGLIKGEYVTVQTDSKKTIEEILKIMD